MGVVLLYGCILNALQVGDVGFLLRLQQPKGVRIIARKSGREWRNYSV